MMYKKFKRFMKKHKAWKAFKIRLSNDPMCGKYTVKEFCRRNPSDFYIANAFIWPDDELNTWHTLSEEWVEKCK